MSLLSYTEIKTTVSESNKYVTESGATTTHHRVCNSFCAHTLPAANGRTDLKVRQIPPIESVSTTLPPMQRKASTTYPQPTLHYMEYHACMLHAVRPAATRRERAARTSRCLFRVPLAIGHESAIFSFLRRSSLAWPHA